MMLFVSLSALGIATAITFLIMPYIAAPTYAGMIFIEFFMSWHEKKVSDFFRFKQPSDGLIRYWMDLIASITTIIGGTYVWILNGYLTHNLEGEFWKLFFPTKYYIPLCLLFFVFVYLSCISLIVVIMKITANL